MNATITGKVAVQNSFGYLPAHEYRNIHFYGWLAIIHVVLSFFWLLHQRMELDYLLPVHRKLTLISLTAMLEVVFTYAALKHINLTGTRHSVLMMAFLTCD